MVWVALSVIATLAFMFGSTVGYRRGFEQARAKARRGRAHGAAEPEIAVEVRLPEDARHAT